MSTIYIDSVPTHTFAEPPKIVKVPRLDYQTSPLALRRTQQATNFSIWLNCPWIQIKMKDVTHLRPPLLDGCLDDSTHILYLKQDDSLFLFISFSSINR